MQKELIRILNVIKQKTGIEIEAISTNGLFMVSTNENNKFINLEKFDNIIQKNGYTHFKFNFNKTEFIGTIQGDEIAQKIYTFFIIDFIENNQIVDIDNSFEMQLKRIIIGESSKSIINTFINKYNIEANNCYCMVVEKKGFAGEICDFLNDYSTNNIDMSVKIDDDKCAYIRFVKNEIENDFQTPSEFSFLLNKAIYEETGKNVNIFVGNFVKNFSEINISYNQAIACERLKSFFNLNNPICSYKDFVLQKIIEELPNFKMSQYINELAVISTEKVFKDDELMLTAKEFINNNLNISETSRVLYIHRNTLMYRLDKIEKYSGYNLKNFNDALVFKVISVLYRCLER